MAHPELLGDKWQVGKHLPGPYDGEVYHYTSAAGLEGIVRSRHVWATHIQALNDTGELEYGLQFIRQRVAERSGGSSLVADEVDQIIHAIDGKSAQVFVTSASSNGNSLPQFRMYSQYCLSLPGRTWAIRGDRAGRIPGARWRPVIYDEHRARDIVDKVLRDISVSAWEAGSINEPEVTGPTSSAILKALMIVALHIKHPAFHSEEEVRLAFGVPDEFSREFVRSRVGPEGVVPYVEVGPSASDELDIRSVCVGPPARSIDLLGVRSLLNMHGYEERVEVTASDLPFRG